MFMGEEWGSVRPFPFFCDFKGALADAVRKGRREEFKSAYQKLGGDIPDPLDERTFRSATLDWEECGRAAGRRRLGLVRELLALRRTRVVPLLADLGFDGGNCRGTVITAAWRTPDGRRLLLLANLSDAAAARPADHRGGAPLWGGDPAATLPPWSVFWSVAAPERRPP
jgi:1,4-alpha-glucan branching enzyme